MEKAMNIGQRVINAYGENGKIVDRMWSEKEASYLYGVHYDSAEEDEILLARGDELRDLQEEKNDNYEVETSILNNVVVAKVFKMENGKKKEFSRGHGHIIHNGDIGIMQALSYAFKKAYEKINNGNL